MKLFIGCVLSLLFTFQVALADAPLIWGTNNQAEFFTDGWYLTGGKQYLSVAVSPAAGGGLAAPVGSVAVRNNAGAGIMYLKTGAADTAWTDMLSAITGVPAGRTINTTTPLAGGGNLSADRTFSITKADASTDGYLSSVDWNIFNDGAADATQALSDIDAHINDTTGAHAGSAISNTPSGNLAATTVQGALNELQTDINGRELALTFSAPLSRSTNTISIPAATGSVDGYLSATKFAEWQGTTNDVANATDANTVGQIVRRDGSGNFAAGTITATLVGNATNVTGTVAVANGGTGQTSYTNGQILIGNTTGNTLAKATITPGLGVGITNGASSITVAQAVVAPVAIAASAIDWSLTTSGGSFTKTLAANTTFTWTPVSGQTIVVRLTNTASNYTVTWPTTKWSGGAAPTQTVGAKSDVYTFYYDGTDVFGSVVQNF